MVLVEVYGRSPDHDPQGTTGSTPEPGAPVGFDPAGAPPAPASDEAAAR